LGLKGLHADIELGVRSQSRNDNCYPGV
jgi:hypothetical protein